MNSEVLSKTIAFSLALCIAAFAGAKEIHMRISCPPLRYPCFYGIDMPTKRELVGSEKTVEEIRKYLEVDSLGYLSIDGLLSAAPEHRNSFCAACFTGNYPVTAGVDPSFIQSPGVHRCA